MFLGDPPKLSSDASSQMALLTDAIGRWIIKFGTVTFHSETRYAHSENGGYCVKLVHLWLETCATVSLLLESVWQLTCNDTTKSNDLEGTFARKSNRWKEAIIKKVDDSLNDFIMEFIYCVENSIYCHSNFIKNDITNIKT